MASPAKRSKCRYDFVAFTWRFVLRLFLRVWSAKTRRLPVWAPMVDDDLHRVVYEVWDLPCISVSPAYQVLETLYLYPVQPTASPCTSFLMRGTIFSMNSLHAVSMSKNNNTQRTAQPVSAQRTTRTVHATVACNDWAVLSVLLFLDTLNCMQTVHFCPIDAISFQPKFSGRWRLCTAIFRMWLECSLCWHPSPSLFRYPHH